MQIKEHAKQTDTCNNNNRISWSWLQSVGNDFHVTQGSQWKENETKESKIVIIGNGLQEDEIRKSLGKLLVEVEV